jgi:hypothetical protein
MAIQLGEVVEDLVLVRPEGTAVRLSEFPARALVMIFLRHLG